MHRVRITVGVTLILGLVGGMTLLAHRAAPVHGQNMRRSEIDEAADELARRVRSANRRLFLRR